ncbi:OLC1v1002884C4 [Oldenlandia corymbosa var. corymbosa]|uniref:OLC1v1002884C4 n=1 Tax=Oldenlandia corymbosa var. corymbosa TaxID=529605 RepID=A0AAV1D8U5_OLDCO|nr:OLC1v1002884C4 [Oldenlandia corymbosa var. corymbosa]
MDSFSPHQKKPLLLLLWLLFGSCFVFTNVGGSKSVVKTLPGFPPGTTLPFTLETGYITVGEEEDVELFYYFIESERDPETDPLLLWLTGGPGCSGFSGLVYEMGPLRFDFEAFDKDGSAQLILNPYSWTKRANIIFLDSPVGTGFSYNTTEEGYNTSDTKASEDVYTFLRKWFLENPKFMKNRLYIAGDSYAGKVIPLAVLTIAQGIEAGVKPKMHLQGYILGNPVTDDRIDGNAQIPYSHRLAILSDKYYKMAKVYCKGEYTNPDPGNALCQYALQLFQMCIKDIFRDHVLEPVCKPTLGDDYSFIRLISPRSPRRCRDDNYIVSHIWANDIAVQEALHVRNGTIKEWRRCNRELLHYDFNMESVVPYHKLLTDKGIQALVYSGDHDMVVPYIGTLEWIRLLNLTVDDDWRPWLVDDQVEGFEFLFLLFFLTFNK